MSVLSPPGTRSGVRLRPTAVQVALNDITMDDIGDFLCQEDSDEGSDVEKEK